MRVVSQITKDLVQDIFSKQNILTYMGARVARIELGEVDIYMPRHELALQHHGYYHGGIISTIADVSAGLAACTYLTDPTHSCLTVYMKINFLHPANGYTLISKGKVLKYSRKLFVSTSYVYSNGFLCAYMLQTVKKIIPRKHDEHH